jgi:transposase
MRKSLSSSERGFSAHDQHRLSRALTQTGAARVFRRIPAVLLLAEGRPFGDTAQLTGLSLQSGYTLVHRYLQSPQGESLHDLPHPGRPSDAPELTASPIVRALRRSPLPLGYRTTGWTVETLAVQLSQRSQFALAPWTLRRRMMPRGVVGKSPRSFYSEKHPHRAQKKGLLCGN